MCEYILVPRSLVGSCCEWAIQLRQPKADTYFIISTGGAAWYNRGKASPGSTSLPVAPDHTGNIQGGISSVVFLSKASLSCLKVLRASIGCLCSPCWHSNLMQPPSPPCYTVPGRFMFWAQFWCHKPHLYLGHCLCGVTWEVLTKAEIPNNSVICPSWYQNFTSSPTQLVSTSCQAPKRIWRDVP